MCLPSRESPHGLVLNNVREAAGLYHMPTGLENTERALMSTAYYFRLAFVVVEVV